MRTNQKSKNVKWSPKAPQRVIGYLSPFCAFVVAVMWLKPVDSLGWIAVTIPAFAAFLFIFIPVLTQTRSEIARRAFDHANYATPRFMASWSQESRFRSPSGEVPMNDFLASQP